MSDMKYYPADKVFEAEVEAKTKVVELTPELRAQIKALPYADEATVRHLTRTSRAVARGLIATMHADGELKTKAELIAAKSVVEDAKEI